MDSSRSFNNKFFERVINPYLPEVMKHPKTIDMCEGVLQIWDVQGPKKMGTVESKLEEVEQEIFRCQGMVESGLGPNHSIITEITHDQNVDCRSLEDIFFTFNEQINFLQGQIFDRQKQIFEYEARFKV
ncbi:40S ribosomal protein S5-1 [Hordeum vulgare]|nr:40S ribosomal protein S5-1 [Hordeum vulgare]